MKKALIIFTLLLNFCLFSKAQFKEIAASPEFNEPYSPSTKLLLTKTGNLVLADVGFRDSIRIRVYNAAHQEIAVTSYEMTNPDKRKYSGITGAFEINGEIVLFIGTEEEKTSTLYRVMVDPHTGQVKKEEKILSLRPLPKNEFYSLWWGNLTVSKCENSDDYAIAFSNSTDSDKAKEVGVLLFNKEHIETARAFYETGEKEFQSLRLSGMQVIDHQKVGLLFIGSTWGDKIGDEGRRMFLGLLKKGSSSLSITKLNLPEENVPTQPLLYYNSYIKKLIVVAVCGGKKVDQYLCLLDPETGKAEKVISYDFSDAFYEKGKNIYGKRYVFYGMPVNFLTDKNGNFSVVYQEEGYWSSGSGGGGGTFYTDIIIADFDKNGKLLNNYLAPRKIFPGGGFGSQYADFVYVKNNNKSWLFFNDDRENIERLEKNKDPKKILSVRGCDAFYFPLTGTEPLPSRKYLFGQTDEKEPHMQSAFGLSIYDDKNDLFITLRLNRDQGIRKIVNMVWLKPQ